MDAQAAAAHAAAAALGLLDSCTVQLSDLLQPIYVLFSLPMHMLRCLLMGSVTYITVFSHLQCGLQVSYACLRLRPYCLP